jgi:hypothetical protein
MNRMRRWAVDVGRSADGIAGAGSSSMASGV